MFRSLKKEILETCLNNLRLSALPRGTSTCGRRKLESNAQPCDCKITTLPTEPQSPQCVQGTHKLKEKKKREKKTKTQRDIYSHQIRSVLHRKELYTILAFHQF
ncbi:hypothetical protein ILYODFUR_039081 [Ilyodon furcidens]|uniref:Uncharacterized protein n=1 Tax=Ilyodon furcidens TaxID=33524 RepID=A0ABV0TQV9_9TELE